MAAMSKFSQAPNSLRILPFNCISVLLSHVPKTGSWPRTAKRLFHNAQGNPKAICKPGSQPAFALSIFFLAIAYNIKLLDFLRRNQGGRSDFWPFEHSLRLPFAFAFELLQTATLWRTPVAWGNKTRDKILT